MGDDRRTSEWVSQGGAMGITINLPTGDWLGCDYCEIYRNDIKGDWNGEAREEDKVNLL